MYSELCEIYGVSIEDSDLLEAALTHPSFVQSHGLSVLKSYERLEFLGDSLLKLAASELLYNMFSEYNEGNLSKIRSFLVSDNTLAEISLSLGLNKFMRLGEGEEKSGGRNRVSNNACMFEALLGAFYLMGKEVEMKSFLVKVLSPKVAEITENFERYNAKEILQEYTQGLDKRLPEYCVVSTTGPAHKQVFVVEVLYNGTSLAIGEGNSKKSAQINAAYQACKVLGIIK